MGDNSRNGIAGMSPFVTSFVRGSCLCQIANALNPAERFLELGGTRGQWGRGIPKNYYVVLKTSRFKIFLYTSFQIA